MQTLTHTLHLKFEDIVTGAIIQKVLNDAGTSQSFNIAEISWIAAMSFFTRNLTAGVIYDPKQAIWANDRDDTLGTSEG